MPASDFAEDPQTRSFNALCCWAILVVGLVLSATGELHGQGLVKAPGDTLPDAQTFKVDASLPRTEEEIVTAINRVETRLGELRRKAAIPISMAAESDFAFGTSQDERTEGERSLQQWMFALDQQGRYLRALKRTRQLNEQRVAEQDAWRGFAQQPTMATAEQLTDEISAQRLQLRTTHMLLPILEGEITRFAARLNSDRRQLRLANDQAEQGGIRSSRRQWVAQLAQLKNDADEASVESAELGRRVAWETLDGQRKYIGFLERKLAVARAQARMTKADLEGVLSQIAAKRVTLQQDLNNAIAADKELRIARDAAFERGQMARSDSVPASRAAGQVEQARVETSGRKVESLRGFLQLADYARTVWEDRLWATEQRTLRQLRAKQDHHQQLLEGLRQWKALMEQSLSAVSEQLLRQALRVEGPSLTLAERESAQAIQATLQERASVELRMVGALAFTEDLTARLHAELSEQVARISFAGKLNAVMEDTGAIFCRIWSTELYIAEDSVIAGGQKVSMPRSITVGKVVIAMTIFLVGLLAARWAYRLARRLVSRWFAAEPHSAEVQAKAFAAVVVLVSLLVAMASVRIPWTVFAFMGGALAIGVGFGAQTLINNFISGVILLCERSIRVGDIVEVDDQRGKIVRVGFRNSLVSRGDGIEVLVPNSQFLEKKVVNWTLSNDLVRYEVSVGVAYGAAPTKVAELIAQAAAEHPHVMKAPAPDVLLEDFGDNALMFGLQFWMHLCPGVDGGAVRSELRHRIHTLLSEAGISIAFPQRDIHLDSVRPLEIKLVEPEATRGLDIPRPRSGRLLHATHSGLKSRASGEDL